MSSPVSASVPAPLFQLGTHSLSSMFTIDDEKTLLEAMRIAVGFDCYLFEITYPNCALPWARVAEIAHRAGITEIALCHYWPQDANGVATLGDPLGNVGQAREALTTFRNIAAAAETLRKGGITVRFVTGPTFAVLGKDYGPSFQRANIHSTVVEFLKLAGRNMKNVNLTLAVEFLRPEESNIVAGTVEMIDILNAVDCPNVLMHFDTLHSLGWNEDPVVSIQLAARHIGYLHLHGPGRVAPGSIDDIFDWPTIVQACKGICSGVEGIGVVSEPFGQAACKECPPLGAGLPPMPTLTEYLQRSTLTLLEAGLPLVKFR